MRCVILSVAAAVVVLALALGLGLGLGLQKPSSPGNNTKPSPWQPQINDTWQIVLSSALEMDYAQPSVTPDVQVFDIDLFDNPSATIEALKKIGKAIICYFSAGSYEPNRPDSSQFSQSDLGNGLDGWPGERWLNVSSPGVRAIMANRIQLASQKGCDAIDPDNVDGYVSSPSGRRRD